MSVLSPANDNRDLDSRQGEEIKGYTLQDLLGAGGFGAVYRATQALLGREVAIKIIHPRHANHPNFIRNFEAEAQLIARLEHPHIVPLYDYWRDPSGAYLVMRYVRGGSLDRALQQGRWDLPDAAHLLEQVGAALGAAHRQGVVHRDVKPANILLDDDRNAYLADFGIAQALETPGPAPDSVDVLTYLAPEQIRGEPVSPQTDIYNLGLVLYQVLGGAPAFAGPTPADLITQQLTSPIPLITGPRPELPSEVAAVLDRATAKNPADRYADTREFIADFRRAAGAGVLSTDELRRLPTGNVGFLFTDIENSTKRWERYPTEMQAALARHDTLMRKAFARTEGRPFQTAGDSFAVAFPTVQDALQCALIAQRLLEGEDWPPPIGAIRVRMGVGLGPAQIRDGGYHAEYTLNRLARLMATAYGGEVVITPVAYAALTAPDAPPLPDGVTLRDLGEHRLKDVSEPIRVHQMVARDLQADFPALKTLDAVLVPSEEENLPEPINPYKGLRAFQEADSSDFFGRTALIHHLLDRLAESGPLSRFLAVVGPSGSGKSSVVRAGLVPALRRNELAGLRNPFVVEIIPGTHPLEEIEQALLRVAVRPADNLLQMLEESPDGLKRAVAMILPADGTELVLVIDQFEEVFTLLDDEARRVHILESLRAAVLAEDSRLRVIVTIRADFYDKPLLYPSLGDLMSQRSEVVVPLNPVELEQAITGPAQRVGVRFEPELLAAITQEVGEQPGTLPLLQYALTELFEERVGRKLTLDAYRAGGGVLGALARRADEIYAELDPGQQEMARQLFLRLVTLGEGVEDTRRRVRLSELQALAADPAALTAVLDQFGLYRLLTFDRDPITRDPTVEVAHEALIRTWSRLRGWLDTSRGDLRLQRQLQQAVHEWATAGRDSSFLASGSRLLHFESLTQTEHTESGVALIREEQEYLEASIAARGEQEAQEEERRNRELVMARQTANAQRQAAQRLRGLVGALGVFLLVALGLALVAYLSQQDAQAQRKRAEADFTRAEAQRLAAEANTLLARGASPEIIGLLSIRAINLQYSPQGDAALLGAAALDYPTRLFAGHTDQVRRLAFSPDGKTILTGSYDGTAKLWDRATGQEIRTFKGHTNQIWGVAVAPDGKTVLTGSYDGTARLWDVATGETIRVFPHGDQVWSVAFAPDGRTILTGSVNKTAKLWDVASGQEVRTFPAFPSWVTAVAYSPDSQTALIAGGDNTVRRWNLATGQEILPALAGHTAQVYTAIFSPDGSRILSAGFDHTAWLWDSTSGQPLMTFKGHTDVIEGVAFSPDGSLVLTGSRDKTARLWDTRTGSEVRRFIPNAGGVTAVAFAPDGASVLMSGSGDNYARLWDVRPRAELPTIPAQTGRVWAAHFSPDGKLLVTAGADGTARLWDADTGRLIRSFTGHSGVVSDAVFSPDGKTLLTAGFDKTAKLWDVATGREIRTLTGHTDLILTAAFAPDGKTVVTGGDVSEKAARVWDVATGRQLLELGGHGSAVGAVAYSPDSAIIATGSEDKITRLWDAATGKEIRELAGHGGWVYGLAFSPDGKTLLTASQDKTAKLWDVASGQELRTLRGHTANVWHAAFAPDGKTVLTGSSDLTARLWDAATGQELRRFVGHSDIIWNVAYAPDGKTVVTASNDGTARLWHTQYDDTVQYLCGRLLRDFSADERTQYGVSADPTCHNP